MDCEEYHRVAFTRSPQPLTFEASSGIFVGNAGGTGLPRFVVSRGGTSFIAACVSARFVAVFLVSVSSTGWKSNPPVVGQTDVRFGQWPVLHTRPGQKKTRNE